MDNLKSNSILYSPTSIQCAVLITS